MKPKKILPAIAVAIFSERREILLQRRKDSGKWCVLSGHVEYGETVENAVLREIEEETGSTGFVKRFIGIYSSPQSQIYDYDEAAVHYITSYFEAGLSAQPENNFQNEETLELKFFAADALPENLANMHPQWLQHALDLTGKTFVA